MKKSLHGDRRRFNKDHAIDDDGPDLTDKVYDIVKDLHGRCKHFAEQAITFGQHCSKRKITALTHMARWMFDKKITDNTHKNTNPSTIKRIKQLISPQNKDVRIIANHKEGKESLTESKTG